MSETLFGPAIQVKAKTSLFHTYGVYTYSEAILKVGSMAVTLQQGLATYSPWARSSLWNFWIWPVYVGLQQHSAVAPSPDPPAAARTNGRSGEVLAPAHSIDSDLGSSLQPEQFTYLLWCTEYHGFVLPT